MRRDHTKRYQVLEFVREFINKEKYSPSYKEIAKAIGLSSLATVHKHVQTLIDLDELEVIRDKKARALRIPPPKTARCPKCRHVFVLRKGIVLPEELEQPVGADACPEKIASASERLELAKIKTSCL